MSWKFYTKNGEMIEKTVEATGCMIATGSYVGDDSTSKSITGVGFRPKYVKIWKHPTEEIAVHHYEKLDQTWGDYCYYPSNPQDNRINSLDADGFTVDDDGTNSNPNANGTTYDWVAFGFGVGSVGTALMKTGTYTGDGSTSQAITGIGFQPRLVWTVIRVVHTAANECSIRWDVQPSDLSLLLGDGTLKGSDDKIISLDADGFTVDDGGGDYPPNRVDEVYDYVAWGTT